MALGAMIGYELLEAKDFSDFILRGWQGELFATGGGRVMSAELGMKS